MDLAFKFRVANVPMNLTHKTRKEEIEDLVNYLELTSSAADNLVMCIKSVGEPSPENRGHIWARVDAAGAPVGMYVWYNGAWSLIGKP